MVPSQSNPYQTCSRRRSARRAWRSRLGEGPDAYPVLAAGVGVAPGRDAPGPPPPLDPSLPPGQFRGRRWAARRTVLELRLLRRLGVRLVWTVHNVGQPRGQAGPLEMRGPRRRSWPLSRRGHLPLRRRPGTRPSTPIACAPEAQARLHVVPHGSYDGLVPGHHRTGRGAREALGLEPTRGCSCSSARSGATRASRTCSTFPDRCPDDARLVVAGKPRLPGLEEPLERLPRDDPRITLRPGRCRTTGCRCTCGRRTRWCCPISDVLTSGSGDPGHDLRSAGHRAGHRMPAGDTRLRAAPSCTTRTSPAGCGARCEAALTADLGALGEQAAAQAAALPGAPSRARMAELYRGDGAPQDSIRVPA